MIELGINDHVKELEEKLKDTEEKLKKTEEKLVKYEELFDPVDIVKKSPLSWDQFKQALEEIGMVALVGLIFGFSLILIRACRRKEELFASKSD